MSVGITGPDTKPGDVLVARQEQLGISVEDLMWVSGLSNASVWDLLGIDDEVYLVDLVVLRRVCGLLRVDPFELLHLACAFCFGGLPYLPLYDLPRSSLVRKTRRELSLSREELGDLVGFEVGAIQGMETESDYLERWPLDYIDNLAEALSIPTQVLLRFQCPVCGR
jgi:hypothetical protein